MLSSVEPDISLSPRSFKTAIEMWKYLQGIYFQVIQSRQFELEYETANISQEGRDIRRFYVEILKLWTEQDMISSNTISSAAYVEIKKERDRGRVMQFLMKLRPEFENARPH